MVREITEIIVFSEMFVVVLLPLTSSRQCSDAPYMSLSSSLSVEVETNWLVDEIILTIVLVLDLIRLFVMSR